jgi:hypothetical protein
MSPKKRGTFQLFVWGALILAGIVSKRIYGHPEWMMLFHGPAAVFLVMGMKNISGEFRAKYNQEAKNLLRRTSST